jgi:hypothetical protein
VALKPFNTPSTLHIPYPDDFPCTSRSKVSGALTAEANGENRFLQPTPNHQMSLIIINFRYILRE